MAACWSTTQVPLLHFGPVRSATLTCQCCTLCTDVAILLGARGADGEGSDNSALVIGVAVAVPVALAAVILIISGTLIVVAIRRRKANTANLVLFEAESRLDEEDASL